MRRNGPSAFARLRGARGREPLWRSRTTLAHRGCVPDRVGAAVPGHPYRAQAGIGAGVLLDPGAVVPDERGPASRRTRPSTTSGSRTHVPTRGFETPAPRPRSRSRARPRRRESDRVRPASRRAPPLPVTIPVCDAPRCSHSSARHRLPGNPHLPHPPRRIARGRRRPHWSRHPHPTLRFSSLPARSAGDGENDRLRATKAAIDIIRGNEYPI